MFEVLGGGYKNGSLLPCLDSESLKCFMGWLIGELFAVAARELGESLGSVPIPLT